MFYPVIVTYSNYGYIDFAENFLTNVQKKAPNHSILFYCLDQQIYDTLTVKYNQENQANLPQITFIKQFLDNTASGILSTTIAKEFHDYGTKICTHLLQRKFEIIKDALEKHAFILYLDCDVVFMNEIPIKFYSLHTQFDIVFQSDSYPSNTRDNIVVCNGIMLIRNSSAVQRFIETIIQVQNEYPDFHDQECVYAFFQKHNVSKLGDLENILGLKAICARWNVFMAGIYVRDAIAMPGPTTYLFHANHVIGKAPKIKLLEQVGEWVGKN
jgi:hypothetical protein